MRKLYLLTFCILVLFGTLPTTPVIGASKKKKEPPTEHRQPTISSVTQNAITVSDQAGTTTFAITQFTEIYVNERKAKAVDLKPGMTVTVTVGADPGRASRIEASGK